eukprot:m.73523 g.73523  ORF g.73523 m.73523 type:complete len:316 (+) comp12369_c0_seq1:160-1107(+)
MTQLFTVDTTHDQETALLGKLGLDLLCDLGSILWQMCSLHVHKIINVWCLIFTCNSEVDGLLQIGKKIVRVLNTNRQPQEVVSNANCGTVVSWHRCVCHDGWKLSKGLYGTQTFGEGKDLDVLEELLGLVKATLDSEGHHTTEAGVLGLGDGMARVGLKTRVNHLFNLWVSLKEAGNSHGVAGVHLHAQVQGLQATVHHVAVEWSRNRTGSKLDELQALRQLIVRADGNTHEHITMAVQVLCDGGKLDVSTEGEWALEVWRHKSVVNHNDDVLTLGTDGSTDCLDVSHLQQGVGWGFKPHHLGVLLNGLSKLDWV